MQSLEPVRAWSRACHLVIEHYDTAKSCQDPVLRAAIVDALLMLPVSLAESTSATHPEKIYDAMASARTCLRKNQNPPVYRPRIEIDRINCLGQISR